ncbi:MAG: hypothetical protein AAFO94_02060, partial [Bacteroidota bacterium]
KHLPLLNGCAYLVTVVVNFFAVTTPFFGRRPGDVSHLYNNAFTPADFTFKIWPVIYALLAFFIWWQSARWFKRADRDPVEVQRVGYLFLLTCAFNICWLISWQSLHLVWSFVFMVALWATLIAIYYALAPMGRNHWMVTMPFSAYLAWVAVAALANLNVLLIEWGFNYFGLSAEAWTSLLIGVGVFGGYLVLWLNRDWWFSLVLIWALFGIYIKTSTPGAGGGIIVNVCLVGMLLLAMGAIFTAFNNRGQGQKPLPNPV